MNVTATMDFGRKMGSTFAPVSSLMLSRHSSLLKSTDGVSTSAGRTSLHEWGELPRGHDFSEVSVYSVAKYPKSCPLALATPRACPFGGACHSCPARVQSKLAIGQPDNEYEQEADRMAEQVIRMPDAAAATSPDAVVRRKSALCDDDQELLHRDAVQPSAFSLQPAGVPPIVYEVLRSPGQPLDAQTRAFMAQRFGHDFSQVRVHTDTHAVASAQALNARAYAVNNEIVFGRGQYERGTSEGRRFMTHELTHTIQQAGSQPAVVSRVTDPAAPAEQEANSAASVLVEKCFVPARASSVRLARQAATRLEQGTASGSSECVPAPGIPNSNCSAYMANAWWLPLAYVNNATCACRSTPNVPSANCVRRFLQDRLAVTPSWLKVLAASQKPLEANPVTHGPYQTFVQAMLTPRIYGDHVDAYRSCCCPSGPAPFPAWIGVTLVPIQPCSLVGLTIRYFGSCSGTPGAW